MTTPNGGSVSKGTEVEVVPPAATEETALTVTIEGVLELAESDTTDLTKHLLATYLQSTHATESEWLRSAFAERLAEADTASRAVIVDQFVQADLRKAEILAEFMGVENLHVDEEASLLERFKAELANPDWDFRTVSGLARALDAPRREVSGVLAENPGLVRWVAATNHRGEQLLVSADRPVTRDERYLELRSALAKSYA